MSNLEGTYTVLIDNNPAKGMTLKAVVCIDDVGSWGVMWRVTNTNNGERKDYCNLRTAARQLWGD